MSIDKTRNGKFRVRLSYKGVDLPSRTFDLKRDAVEWETAQKRGLQLGTWTDPRAGDEFVGAAIDRFNASRIGAVGQHTWQTDESHLRLHFPASMKKRPISTITKGQLDTIFNEMLRTHSRGTVSRFRNSLSSFYAWAVRQELVRYNIVTDVRLARGQGTDVDAVAPFTAVQLAQTIEAQRLISPAMAAVTEFAALTGLRWGEIVALRVSTLVETPLSAIVVRRSQSDGFEEKTTKSGAIRRVPLTSRAREIFEQYAAGKDGAERVFTSPNGSHLNAGNSRRLTRWTETAAGHRFHDLRHTAATLWLQAGVDVKTASAWLGHSDTAITLRTYSHYMNSDSDRAAMDRLERLQVREVASADAPPVPLPASVEK